MEQVIDAVELDPDGLETLQLVRVESITLARGGIQALLLARQRVDLADEIEIGHGRSSVG